MKPRLCNQMLHGKRGFRARCTRPWGEEHSHNDLTAEQAVKAGVAVPASGVAVAATRPSATDVRLMGRRQARRHAAVAPPHDAEHQLADLEREFAANGGRGVEMAEEIDRLRRRLHKPRFRTVREHVFSDPAGGVPRCIHCGCDEDDAFVGGAECVSRRVPIGTTTIVVAGSPVRVWTALCEWRGMAEVFVTGTESAAKAAAVVFFSKMLRVKPVAKTLAARYRAVQRFCADSAGTSSVTVEPHEVTL